MNKICVLLFFVKFCFGQPPPNMYMPVNQRNPQFRNKPNFNFQPAQPQQYPQGPRPTRDYETSGAQPNLGPSTNEYRVPFGMQNSMPGPHPNSFMNKNTPSTRYGPAFNQYDRTNPASSDLNNRQFRSFQPQNNRQQNEVVTPPFQYNPRSMNGASPNRFTYSQKDTSNDNINMAQQFVNGYSENRKINSQQNQGMNEDKFSGNSYQYGRMGNRPMSGNQMQDYTANDMRPGNYGMARNNLERKNNYYTGNDKYGGNEGRYEGQQSDYGNDDFHVYRNRERGYVCQTGQNGRRPIGGFYYVGFPT